MRCSAERRIADAGPRLLAFSKNRDLGSAAHHCVLRCARDTRMLHDPCGHFPSYQMRYNAPTRSSDTRIDPSGSCATSTGRPKYSPLSFQPSANGSVLSAVPSSFRLVNITLAPTGTVRFHEPCCAEKMPPRYFAGNILPE